MQTRLVVHKGIDIQRNRKGVARSDMNRAHLVRRAVRRDLDGGASRGDGGGELRRELHHIARRDIRLRRCQRQTGDGLCDDVNTCTGVGGEQRARRERGHAIDAPMIQVQRI